MKDAQRNILYDLHGCQKSETIFTQPTCDQYKFVPGGPGRLFNMVEMRLGLGALALATVLVVTFYHYEESQSLELEQVDAEQ